MIISGQRPEILGADQSELNGGPCPVKRSAPIGDLKADHDGDLWTTPRGSAILA